MDRSKDYFVTTGWGPAAFVISGPWDHETARAKAAQSAGPVSVMQGTHPLLPAGAYPITECGWSPRSTNEGTRVGGSTSAPMQAASQDASLGVGHIWTAVSRPAYRSLRASDCTCNHTNKEV